MRKFVFQINFLTTLCALSFASALYTEKWALVCLAVATLGAHLYQTTKKQTDLSKFKLELEEKWKVFDHNFLTINQKIVEIDDKASKAILSKLTHK
jgi:hypothetical protein